jgi:hypothetical protein
VGEPLQGAVDFRSGHQLRLFDDFHLREILAQAGAAGRVTPYSSATI